MNYSKFIFTCLGLAFLVSCSKDTLVEPEIVQEGLVTPDLPVTIGQHELTVQWDCIDREVLINIPEGYSESGAHPLVLFLHGGGGNAYALMSGHSNFIALTETENMILVAPQGTLTQSGAGYKWNSWDDGNATDDVGFIAALIEWLTEGLAINENRRFITGFSNGAAMTQRFAAEKPEMILGAAAVCHSSGYSYIPSEGGGRFELPEPIGPVSMLMIRGGADLTIPPTHDPNPLGKIYDTPMEQQNFWLEANECDNSIFDEGTISPDVYYSKYETCLNSTQVHAWYAELLEHKWPNDATEFNIDVNQIVIDFFLAQ